MMTWSVVPVPERAAVTVPPGDALRLNPAERAPTAVGENRNTMSQLAWGASPLLAPAQLLVGSARKSPGVAPPKTIPKVPLEDVNGPDGRPPSFVIVNAWAALAPPTPTDPKSCAVGVSVRCAGLFPTAKLTVTDCGELYAVVDVTWTVAV